MKCQFCEKFNLLATINSAVLRVQKKRIKTASTKFLLTFRVENWGICFETQSQRMKPETYFF